MTAVALQVKVGLPAEACSPCLGRAPDLEQQGRGQTSSSENGRRNKNDARMSSATKVEVDTHAGASSGKTAEDRTALTPRRIPRSHRPRAPPGSSPARPRSGHSA